MHHPRLSLWQRIARAGRDRRGVTTVVIATSGSIIIGMAALATEGASWYLAARNASTAADLAALAGAGALTRGAQPSPVALATASRNGFSAASPVQVYSPPVTGAYAGNAAAVEVSITQTPRLSLASLFLAKAPVVRARAVAAANADEEVCILALNQLDLGGNSTTQATRCALAAGAGGINVLSNATVRAATLVTTGACLNCTTGNVWADNSQSARPVIITNRATPVTDPFASLASWTPTPTTCRTVPIGRGNVSITPAQGAICTDLAVGVNDTLTMAPGLYYFRNANFTLQGRINAPGVTMVFTGDPDRVGTLRISDKTGGTLTGPTSSLIPGHSAAQGVVIYRDARATANGSTREVQLNGGSTMTLRGAVYAPTSDVIVNGSTNLTTTCLSLVAWNMSFSGQESTNVDVAGCAGYTNYGVLRTVRLVE